MIYEKEKNENIRNDPSLACDSAIEKEHETLRQSFGLYYFRWFTFTFSKFELYFCFGQYGPGFKLYSPSLVADKRIWTGGQRALRLPCNYRFIVFGQRKRMTYEKFKQRIFAEMFFALQSPLSVLEGEGRNT